MTCGIFALVFCLFFCATSLLMISLFSFNCARWDSKFIEFTANFADFSFDLCARQKVKNGWFLLTRKSCFFAQNFCKLVF